MARSRPAHSAIECHTELFSVPRLIMNRIVTAFRLLSIHHIGLRSEYQGFRLRPSHTPETYELASIEFVFFQRRQQES